MSRGRAGVWGDRMETHARLLVALPFLVRLRSLPACSWAVVWAAEPSPVNTSCHGAPTGGSDPASSRACCDDGDHLAGHFGLTSLKDVHHCFPEKERSMSRLSLR